LMNAQCWGVGPNKAKANMQLGINPPFRPKAPVSTQSFDFER
jgi:hypothetical protein